MGRRVEGKRGGRGGEWWRGKESGGGEWREKEIGGEGKGGVPAYWYNVDVNPYGRV